MLCRVSHAETLLLGLLLVLLVDLHGVGHDVAYFPAAVHVRIVIELGHRLSDPGAEDRSSMYAREDPPQMHQVKR